MPSQDLQTQPSAPKASKPYKGMAMEGIIARWYTAIRQGDAELEAVVRQVSDMLPAGGRVLEVAPGPGYLEPIRITQYGILFGYANETSGAANTHAHPK